MDKIEEYVTKSGEEIGAILDDQKMGIYDWNDKIVKSVKKFDKMRKKKGSKEEIKSKFYLFIVISHKFKIAEIFQDIFNRDNFESD